MDDDQDSSNFKSDKKKDQRKQKLKLKNAEESSDIDIGDLEDVLNGDQTSEFNESEKKSKNNKKVANINNILNGSNKNKTPNVALKKTVLS